MRSIDVMSFLCQNDGVCAAIYGGGQYQTLWRSAKSKAKKKKNKFVSSRPRAFRFALKVCAFHFFPILKEKKNP